MRLVKELWPVILLSVGLPIATYYVARSAGASEVLALLLMSIGPLVEIAYSRRVKGRVDELSVFILLMISVGVVAAAVFRSPQLLLLRETITYGLVGSAFLISAFTRRPAVFVLCERFVTDGSAADRRRWRGLWDVPAFRRNQRIITLAWSLALIGASLVQSVLVFRLSVDVMAVVTTVVPPLLGTVLAALTWCVRVGVPAEHRAASSSTARDDTTLAESSRRTV